jgi:uncharacterized membrane protein HdeD (DUF308 family)
MRFNGRVIVELVGGLVAIVAAFVAYFSNFPGLWIGLCVGVGCILLGSAALTLSQMQEK